MTRSDQFERVAAHLREQRDAALSLRELSALAQIVSESLNVFRRAFNDNLHHDLDRIASYVAHLRAEIDALGAHELHGVELPAAGKELVAVVEATETAANDILQGAEAVMTAQLPDSDAYKAFVNARMLALIEACSFQDLTGQRISKVCDALQRMQRRLARFADVARTNTPAPARAVHLPPAGAPGQTGVFAFGAARRPMSQSEIDQLFGT
jgi:chemotaxis protein CheZ